MFNLNNSPDDIFFDKNFNLKKFKLKKIQTNLGDCYIVTIVDTVSKKIIIKRVYREDGKKYLQNRYFLFNRKQVSTHEISIDDHEHKNRNIPITFIQDCEVNIFD